MRVRSIHFLLVCMFLAATACAGASPRAATPSTIPRGPDLHAVFAGTTPCSAKVRPLPQIPADSDCEQMIWKLLLYQDPQTGSPTTYHLESAYGRSKPNTNELIGGGTSILMQGTWSIATGTKTDPDAVIYRLNSEEPRAAVSFQKINENLIHVLNADHTMLVGNGAWSYTLNRMDNQSSSGANELPASIPDPPTRPPVPSMPEGSSVFGVFEGRTPCHELVFEVMMIEPFPGCLKLKWRVTLYQDAITGAPGTYLSMGTSTFREGAWTILRGIEGDPDAVVVQLDLGDPRPPLSLLHVDENHLFLMDRSMNLLAGNELFSYTLSRIDPGSP